MHGLLFIFLILLKRVDDLIFWKKKKDEMLLAILVFDHCRGGRKIKLEFFYPKNYFLIFFHLKTPNKYPYNVNQPTYLLKTHPDWSKSTKLNWNNFSLKHYLLFPTRWRVKYIFVKHFSSNETCWHQEWSFYHSNVPNRHFLFPSSFFGRFLSLFQTQNPKNKQNEVLDIKKKMVNNKDQKQNLSNS